MESKSKKDKLNKYITIILIGLLLLIVVVPIGNDSKDKVSSSSKASDTRMNLDSESEYIEKRLKEILEKSYGQGTMDVMVHMSQTNENTGMYQESTLEVDGILIVADVVNESSIGDITFAVCALFDLPAHKVAVIKK